MCVPEIIPSHLIRIASANRLAGADPLAPRNTVIDTVTSIRHPALAQGLTHRSPALEEHVLKDMQLAPIEEPLRSTARINWYESALEIIAREENNEHDAAWFSRLTPSGPLSWRFPLRT